MSQKRYVLDLEVNLLIVTCYN